MGSDSPLTTTITYHHANPTTMWAYLFWTVVIAWLFSIRSKRGEALDANLTHGRSLSTSSSSVQRVICCSGQDCEHHVIPVRGSEPDQCSSSRGIQSREARRLLGDDSSQVVSAEFERNFQFRRDIPPHMNTTRSNSVSPNPQRPGKCQVCGDVFPSTRQLKMHITRNHPSFFSSRTSSPHPASVASGKTTSRFRCKDCGRDTASSPDLQRHIAAKHPEKLDRTLRSQFFECDECPRMMDSKHNLEAHKRSHSPSRSFAKESVSANTITTSRKVITEASKPALTPLPDLDVGLGVSAKHLGSTPTGVSGDDSEVCDICETAFDDGFQLRQHKGVHHMWSLFCDPCSTSFDNTAQAMQHYSTEHGARNVHPQRIQTFMDCLVKQDEEDLDPQRIFACEKCGLEHSTRKALKHHYEYTCGIDLPGSLSSGSSAENTPPSEDLPTPIPISGIDTSQQLPLFDLISDFDPLSHDVDPSELGPVHSPYVQPVSSGSSSPELTPGEHYGVIGQPIKLQSPFSSVPARGSSDNSTRSAVVIPSLEPTVPFKRLRDQGTFDQTSTQGIAAKYQDLPIRRHEYIPEMVGDIETQLPNFFMGSPGLETSAFPPIVPGPLPAPTKAPVSAWSQPPRLSLPPSDRPLDHTKVPKFVPNSGRNTLPSLSNLQKAFSSRHLGNGHDISTSQNSDDSQKRGSTRVDSAPRQSWAQRGGPRVWSARSSAAEIKTPDSDGWDVPVPTYNHRLKRAKDNRPSSSPPRRGLQPIWDNHTWEDITPPPPVKRHAPPIRSAQEEDAARIAEWRRKEEECAEITAACIAAGDEDPFGGW